MTERVPDESPEQRLANISAFCKRRGPHLSFGGKVQVGEPVERKNHQVDQKIKKVDLSDKHAD